MRQPVNISVIGGHICTDKDRKLAYRTGQMIAERGWVLVCGGAGGIMESAARGAKEAGGLTVGILPGNDTRQANPFLDVIVPSGLGYARNILVVRAGRAVIAFRGKHGTLSEIAFALNEGKKVYSLHPWEIKGVRFCKDPAEAIRRIAKLSG